MPATKKTGRFWRLCRIYFRRFRITIWLLVLALVGCLLYLDQVGLPGFVKRPLLEKLRAQGIDLEFSRLRLRRLHEIVAEQVLFVRPNDPLSPQLTVKEVQVRLNHKALLHLQLEVESLALRQGRLAWPLTGSNQAPRQLSVENIQTHLQFLPGDQWELGHFQARFAGAAIQLSGTVTNASAIRDWGRFGGPSPAGLWQNRLRTLADTLERIHFSAPPALTIRINGDARDLQSFDIRLSLGAPGAQSPWGAFNHGHLGVRLFPATTNEFARAELNLEANEAGWTNTVRSRWAAATNVQMLATFASAQGETNWANASLVIRAQEAATKWGIATNLQLTLDLGHSPDRTNVVEGSVNVSATAVKTPWAATANARFTAQWLHALTNPIPLSGLGRVECLQVQTEWGTAGSLQLTGSLTEALGPPPAPADPSWGWWTNLPPYFLSWEARLTEVKTPRLFADQIVGRGNWRAPDLVATNLHADVYGGRFDAQASLNIATRALRGSLTSNVDPHRISPLLFPQEPGWLAACSWDQPPEVKAEASLVLPAWTNAVALKNWRMESQPSLMLLGEITIASNAAYKGAAFSAAHSHLIYSNQFWRLPDILVTRPEGRLEAAHEASDLTGDFYWRIASTINPAALRPLLATNQQPAFDYFAFTAPPVLNAELRGRGSDLERLDARGHAFLTNFTFRGESVSSLQTAFQYSNRVFRVAEPLLERGTQLLRAASVVVDLNVEKIFITNGFSSIEPLFVARAIGPHIVKVINPYQFTHPPIVRGQGVLPIHGEEAADFHFDILEGGEFHWWRFTVPRVTARLHWRSHQLTITDAQTDFYGGQATGSAAFDFAPRHPGTEYRFSLTTTNTFLQSLVPDLFPGTNHLAGFLSGNLTVTSANTTNDHSVQGYGHTTLRDGLIWSFPVFGVFSPIFNGIYPGMGNSRASEAVGTFTITNGLIHSDDLDIRTTGMRLQYRGDVDLEGRVNARAEGSLLRDTWLVGPIVSTVFWPVTKMFEYKVTGSLRDPKTEPLFFLSKIVLFPLHPLRTLKGLLPDDTAPPGTNSPPFKSP